MDVCGAMKINNILCPLGYLFVSYIKHREYLGTTRLSSIFSRNITMLCTPTKSLPKNRETYHLYFKVDFSIRIMATICRALIPVLPSNRVCIALRAS